MELIQTFLTNPITIAVLSGLTCGLLITLYILIKTRFIKTELEDEIADARYDYRRLEEQMNTQMRVSAKAQEELQNKIETQQTQLSNQELTIQNLSNKPARKELKSLHKFIRAEEILKEKNPGSLLIWENAKKDAENDFLETEKGLRPMLRRVFSNDQPTKN